MGHEVGREEPAHDPDVGLEHAHVDVFVEVDLHREKVVDATEFRMVAYGEEEKEIMIINALL